jgi:PAS domain S-box-containing protein
MTGYDREDLASGRLRWTELTPPEWRDRDVQLVHEHKVTGRLQPFEKEYFRKDGSRVPVLIGTATFEDGGDEGVAFVLDLTARKQAEAEARESERRYHAVQIELAHANRVAMLGELTASIAHEVNQPIGATLVNAETAQRWLDRQPPDLERATQAISRIVQDSKRTADIIERLRGLGTKAPASKDELNLNEAILGDWPDP